MIKMLSIILLSVVNSMAIASTDSPKDIIEKHCSLCHNVSLIYDAKKNKAEWTETIGRMINYGAHLTNGEKEALIKYLQRSE
jgi:cytochrome c5